MKEQTQFFEALRDIQEQVVAIKMCNHSSCNNIEGILYDATFAMTVGIMELIDGYGSMGMTLDVVDRVTKKSLRDGTELHDKCVDYLKYVSECGKDV